MGTDPASDMILAFDFGGTKLAVGVASVGATTWRRVVRVPRPADSDAADNYAQMISLAREILAGRPPLVIGVSFGGPVDSAEGIVQKSFHVAGWERMPLAARLSAEFGAPARIDNDGNAAALGEYRFGAGQGCLGFLYVTVSTGVGGGWVLNGRVWRGRDGLAGEIGHVTVDPDGPECLCGGRGCVERLASGPWMARHAQDLLARHPDRGTFLRAAVGNELGLIDARCVALAAEQGDDVAQEALDQAAHSLGVGLGNALNLMNPDRIALGGGVSGAGPRYWRAVRAAATATAMPGISVEIVPATLGDEAPLWGAVALASEALD